MTYNTNSLVKSRTPYDCQMMNIYNRHSIEMNYDLPYIFFPKKLNVENFSETVFIPNTNFFTIGKNLSEWGCDNFKTNSQLVIVQAAVPNGNVSENSSTDVDAYGMFIFEPFCPNFKLNSNGIKGNTNECSSSKVPNICPLVSSQTKNYNVGTSMKDWGCNNYKSDMQIVYATKAYNTGIYPNASQTIQENDLFVVQPGSNNCSTGQFCDKNGCCQCNPGTSCTLWGSSQKYCNCLDKCCVLPNLRYIPFLGTLHYMDTESTCNPYLLQSEST